MKKGSKKVRKCVYINANLLKRARKILNACSDSNAIELALKPIAERKTDEEMWEETRKFVRSLNSKNFKPLFS